MKVEGKNALKELISSGKAIEKVLVQNGMRDSSSTELKDMLKARKIKVQYADKSALDRESATGRHQGFIAYTEDYVYSTLEDILESAQDGIIVILNEIIDPHNLGSIIRVCECAGVKGIIIPKNRSATVNENVIRISEGSANHIKIAKITNVNSTVEKVKEAGFWTYALEVGGQDIYKTDLKGKLCLVIGGEDAGVGKITRERCDGVLEIPMAGKVNSLNASVACGIAVYEAVRQRR